MSGQVYFVRNNEGHCKIGMTYDLQSRISQLQVSSSTKLELMFVIHSDKPDLLEREMHRRFQHKWIRGEWFSLDDSDFDVLLNEAKNHVIDKNHQDSIIRASAFDVRPICGRQQHSASKRRKDVSIGRSPFDHAGSEPVFSSLRRKHEVGLSPILRKERQDDCFGDRELHDDRAIRHTDTGERKSYSFQRIQRTDTVAQERCETRKRNSKSKNTSNAQVSLDFGF